MADLCNSNWKWEDFFLNRKTDRFQTFMVYRDLGNSFKNNILRILRIFLVQALQNDLSESVIAEKFSWNYMIHQQLIKETFQLKFH